MRSSLASRPSTRVLLLAAVLVIGCGKSGDPSRPKTVPVSGTVTLKGQPVAGAQLVFQPDGSNPGATGATDADGKYTLMTFQSGDGAVPGQYKVSITKNESVASGSGPSIDPKTGGMTSDYVPPTPGAKPAEAKNLLPPKYAQASTSGLTATVKESGGNQIDFPLE